MDTYNFELRIRHTERPDVILDQLRDLASTVNSLAVQPLGEAQQDREATIAELRAQLRERDAELADTCAMLAGAQQRNQWYAQRMRAAARLIDNLHLTASLVKDMTEEPS